MQTFIFLMVVIIAVCVIITLVILSQNPNGRGLSSTFGGSGGVQMFGVKRTNEFLDNATWTLAGLIVALIITANVLTENPHSVQGTEIESIPMDLPDFSQPAGTDADTAPATPPTE